MGKSHQFRRIAVHLDATFPNSMPRVVTKHRGNGAKQIDLRARDDDHCHIPFYVKSKDEWHWDCIGTSSGASTYRRWEPYYTSLWPYYTSLVEH